jgi:branched-chain amino acid transport system substrate-binding protein
MISLVMVLAIVISLFTGCASTSSSSSAAPAASDKTIKIGIVNPTTGKLAGFGEGCPWTENQIVDYVNKSLGGITVDGKKLPIQIIVYHSTSDTTVCAEMAQKLCEQDKVNLIIARHTPETVNPVAAVAERYGVPCVAIEGPVDAVAGAGPYKNTYHAFWTLDMMYDQYKALWTKAGFGPGKGYKIGVAFANDADGTAWYGVFTKKLVADGYKLVDPGQYPDSTTDFTSIIKTFKDANIDILTGTNINPNFHDLWSQALQAGLNPKVVTMGKADLLQSDAEAIGKKIMNGVMTEVWWSPTHPYTSDLTKMTPAKLAEQYKKESGKEITQPMGYKYASMEIAVAALTKAASLKPDAIVKALAGLSINTIVGPIKYDKQYMIKGQNYLSYSQTPLCGGQWQYDAATDTLKLVIIDNTLFPNIPTTGTFKQR